MTTKTLSQLRDADFARSLRASLKRFHQNNERPTSTQIIADALASRPERYYLTYRTVETKLGRLRKEIKSYHRSHLSPAQQQWADMTAAVNLYLTRHKKATMAEAITHVITIARPSRFFISERKARELFRRTLSREYCFVK